MGAIHVMLGLGVINLLPAQCDFVRLRRLHTAKSIMSRCVHICLRVAVSNDECICTCRQGPGQGQGEGNLPCAPNREQCLSSHYVIAILQEE